MGLGSDERLSETTIADWYSYCRQAVLDDFVTRESDRGQIGGESKIVQIDESKVGKRKNNKGRRYVFVYFLMTQT